MGGTVSRSFDEPDESLAFDHGRIDWVVIGDQTIGRTIQSPAGGGPPHPADRRRRVVPESARRRDHLGRMHIVMEEGEEFGSAPKT